MKNRLYPIVLSLCVLAACDEQEPQQTPTEPVAAAVVATPSLSVSADSAAVEYLCPQGPRAAREVEAGAEGDFNGNGVICDLYAQRSPARAGAIISMDDVPALRAR